jgi:hypothetical protein
MTPSATPKVNIEAKNQLARLLASENIWIQHRKVPTASFDLVNRVLTFPIWKAMSDSLYTLLAGHEVGHALWSEKSNVLDIGKRIDPQNPYLAAMYWNIVEDARIERMIKELYPGLVRTFVEAYKELFDKNFFGTAGRRLDSFSFADRINLHFKVGNHLVLVFDQQEEVFLDKISKTITADDVVEVAKELYQFAKNQQLQPPPMSDLEKMIEKMKQQAQKQQGQGESDDNDNEDEDDDGFGQQQNVPIFSEDGEGESKDDLNVEPFDKAKKDKNGKGKGQKPIKDQNADKEKGEGDKDGEGNGDDDQKDSGKDADKGTPGKAKGQKSSGLGEDGEGQQGKLDKGKAGQGKKPGTGKEALKPVDPGPPPEPTTQRAFDEKLLEYNDKNALPVEYVTVPKPNLKNILVDFEKVHAGIRSHNWTISSRNYWDSSPAAISNEEHFAKAEKAFSEFRDLNKPKIDYVFQQFEMKKQADRYKRTRQHKTGSVDPLRLWAFRTEEDLFKSIAVVTDAKNHGLIFVVDWSASMRSSMAGTIEQMIMLCLFCRKANIPFEVYALTTGSRGAFSREPGNLVYADNFRMRCYLSSRMTTGQFHAACINLFALMPNGSFSGGPTADNLIGCTPLDEAIITTIEIMKEFRNRTQAQIVNAIFMTDGDANTVSGYLNAQGRNLPMDHQTRYLIDDRQTHKVYDFVQHEMTPTMLKILRDRQNINVVGFYIGGSWEGFFHDLDDKGRKEVAKKFKDDGFVIATAWGYNELYITHAGEQWKVREKKLRPQKIQKGTDKYEEALSKNFIDQQKSIVKQRVMLDRFVKMIA